MLDVHLLLPSADQMKVQVEDVLSAPTLHVEDKFVTGFANPLIRGYVLGPEHEFGQNSPVFLFKVVDASNVLSRHEKDMDRGVGFDILKGDQMFILVDDVGGLFPLRDSAEYAFAFHSLLPFRKKRSLHSKFRTAFYSTTVLDSKQVIFSLPV
jgi:hypothetical protein